MSNAHGGPASPARLTPWANGKNGKRISFDHGPQTDVGIFSVGVEDHPWKDSVQSEPVRIWS